jgi:hypothetical protein
MVGLRLVMIVRTLSQQCTTFKAPHFCSFRDQPFLIAGLPLISFIRSFILDELIAWSSYHSQIGSDFVMTPATFERDFEVGVAALRSGCRKGAVKKYRRVNALANRFASAMRFWGRS